MFAFRFWFKYHVASAIPSHTKLCIFEFDERVCAHIIIWPLVNPVLLVFLVMNDAEP